MASIQEQIDANNASWAANAAARAALPAPAGPGVAAGQAAASQLPGYSTSIANIGGNIQNETAGILPEDVKYQLAQAAAERGVASGSPGGANTDADYLRGLGLTSLNLTNLGEQNLNAMLPNLPGYALSQNQNYYQNVQQSIEKQLQERLFSLQQQQAQQAQQQQQLALETARQGLAAGAGSYQAPRGGGATTGGVQQKFVDSLGGYTSGYTNPPAVGAIGGGTTIGGQVYYGSDVPGGGLSTATQIANQYSPYNSNIDGMAFNRGEQSAPYYDFESNTYGSDYGPDTLSNLGADNQSVWDSYFGA